MRQGGVRLSEPTWSSPAFAAVDTRTVAFDDAPIENDAVVGTSDWYLQRPGFWHGAVGVAACWAGSAQGLVDRLRPDWPSDAHAIAHLGAIDAALWAMRAAITTAAGEIDTAPDESADDRRRRALRVRHVVDTLVADITTRAVHAVGPAPLAYRPDLHRVLAETDLYRRQCHAERDLAELGHLTAASDHDDASEAPE